jgi:DNA-binding MltR family transcriptional regulator
MAGKLNLDKDNLNDFLVEFQHESPRAAVIVSGALLDTMLRDLIASFLIDDHTVVDGLLGTDNNSETPLSSFSARIKTAYCLGLISKTRYQDLMIIKKIRNKFAHRLHGYSFETKEVIDWCNSLQIPKQLPDQLKRIGMGKSCRDKYELTVVILMQEMSLIIDDKRYGRRTTPEEIEQIFKG